jgi:hypothetical protein
MTATTTAEPRVIRIGTPAGLLDAIPLLIGFEPADSLVVLGCRRGGVMVTLRYDLDLQGRPVADIAEHPVAILAGNDARTLVAVGYGPAGAVDPLIAAIARATAGTGVVMPLALRVEDGRYFTYDEDGPAEGTPFTAARHPGVLASREELAAHLAPAGGPDAEMMAQATAQAAAGPSGRVRSLAAMADVIARYRDGGHLAGYDEAACLLAALRHLCVRDDAWARMDPAHKAAHLRLWTDLTRQAPAGHIAAPASLLAFVAWQRGNGALANVALDRALADDPRYSMGQLLRQVIESGAPPSLAVPPMTPEEVAASYDDLDEAGYYEVTEETQ